MDAIVSRRWVVSLACLAGVAALLTARASVTSTGVRIESGSSVVEETSYSPFGFVALGLMLLTAALAIASAVLVIRRKRPLSERLLLATGIVGLLAVVPGLLALSAWILDRRTRRA